jgi:hypothetical protein
VSGLTLSGTVTTTGNLTLGGTLSVAASNFSSQTANIVLASPNGSAGTPTFRALVAADIPTLNQNTTGSAGSLSVNSTYMVSRGGVAEASVDTATSNGFYIQNNTSDSDGLLVFAPGGSLGTFQLHAKYTGLLRFRNRTDNTTWTSWKTILHNANYNTYSPTLTGTGASGSWGISITGNAATATSASSIDGVAFNNSNAGNAVTAADTLDSNGIGYVTNISLLGQVDGALYSQAYSSTWQHQIYGDYRTGQIVVRGKNNGTWQSWRTILDSSNFGSFITGANNGTLTLAVSGSGLSGSQTFTANQAANATFTVTSNATSANTASTIVLRDASGNFTAGVVTATDFNSTSDAILKKDIESINGLAILSDINPVQFNWKNSGKRSYGVIAQELEKVLPELVGEREDGMKSVAYVPMIALLIDAVKKLDARVRELESK